MDYQQVIEKKIYLPFAENGIDDTGDYLRRYIKSEFPTKDDNKGPVVYSVPHIFRKSGEKQATLAEAEVFNRLKGVNIDGLWLVFFHSANYGGYSSRNHRLGKLMIREHDFVVFAKFEEKYYVVLIEVKSTKDNNLICTEQSFEKTSDSKEIKNNKRSAMHQLKDHLEVLEKIVNEGYKNIQSYIMWPFLSPFTKNPQHQVVKRWKEDKKLHAFHDTLGSQTKFDEWFIDCVLGGTNMQEAHFMCLLHRFVILSCGVFVDEINKNLLALLTQEQLQLLNGLPQRGPLTVYGAAGTGKTLLVLKKLERLYCAGDLNAENKALYICYWPGIRCYFELKLEAMGIRKFVDTSRFFVTMDEFYNSLPHTDKANKSYKHIFFDESEALCLSYSPRIMQETLAAIYKLYHSGNCHKDCPNSTLGPGEDLMENILKCHEDNWGELWFMVDINQVAIFRVRQTPRIFKEPALVLKKVMRSTGYIFDFFRQFSTQSLTKNIFLGHKILGPPIFWSDSKDNITKSVAGLIIDLCTSKGFKANDICVIPFLVNEKLTPEIINGYINEKFVENGCKLRGVGDVEYFLMEKQFSDFLLAWALRLKGLEFKVVILVVDDDDFEINDLEDRSKIYVIASRCTSLLILVSQKKIKDDIDKLGRIKTYPFCTYINVGQEIA